jgi:thiamine biosynthesis lipoprotein ApbE
MILQVWSLAFSLFQLFSLNPLNSNESKFYFYNYENVLGTSFQLKVSSGSEKNADYAELVALNEIDRLTGILSTYDPSSEVSLWQKQPNVETKVSPELFEVLNLFDIWQDKTYGAISTSVGTATRLWKNAQASQMKPGEEDLRKAAQSMVQPQWKLNPANRTAIKLTNQPIVLNSFVKSYIIKKVAGKLLDLPGVQGVVVNIGGDLVIAGNQQEIIGISNPASDAENGLPVSTLLLKERAIATSGNYRRGFQINSQWYSHIIDPRTAYPTDHILSATVIAKNATDAGALATAFNVLQPAESEALALTIPGIEYQLITANGEILESDGWRKFEMLESDQFNAALFTMAQPKLTLEFELATFEGRFRRPFVAVWVENKKKETVKTLALWYNKPRWLPDLKRWYSNNQAVLRDSIAKASISSATRSAGKYTLSWDGLDANGKAVPNGKYTFYIEAAREHGTYQLLKQEIEWNGQPAHFDLKGGIEITSASLTILK